MTTHAAELRVRILAVLRRARVTERLEAAQPDEYGDSKSELVTGSSTNGPSNAHDAGEASLNGHGEWVSDRLSFRPLYDRGGAISLSPTADGPIGALARVELNDRAGDDLRKGLSPDDPLGQPAGTND